MLLRGLSKHDEAVFLCLPLAGSENLIPSCTRRRRSAMLDKRSVVKSRQRLSQLRLCVHHDRPVPRDRLLNRLARHKQKTNPFIPGLHSDFISAAIPSTGPFFPQKSPQITRTLVPSLSVSSGISPDGT